MSTQRFWYVATPYTKFRGTKEEAFQFAVGVLKKLMINGVPAFSPIVHTHPVEVVGGLDMPHGFWMNADRPFMHVACGLIVCCVPDWEESVGIREEIDTFRAARKPIYFWHLNDGQILNYAQLAKEAN